MGSDVGYWVQIVLNCIVSSSLFLIMAVGVNLIFGVNRVINFAHGSLYALGAYFGYTLVTAGLNFFLVLIIAPVIVAVAGVIIERSVIAPIRKKPILLTLILTWGLMMFLDGLIKFVWGTYPKLTATPTFLSEAITIGGMTFPPYRLFIIMVTVVVMVGLLLLMERTKIGMTMRAASCIPEMVSVLGININFVFVYVFALGCALAAIAGVIVSPLFTVHPFMGGEMLIGCFVVVVIGGLGSFRGSVLAALLVGTVRTLGFMFVAEYAMVVVYVALAVVLIIRPRGLLGKGSLM